MDSKILYSITLIAISTLLLTGCWKENSMEKSKEININDFTVVDEKSINILENKILNNTENIHVSAKMLEAKELNIQKHKIIANFIGYNGKYVYVIGLDHRSKKHLVKVVENKDDLDAILTFFQEGDSVEITIDQETSTLIAIRMIEINDSSRIVNTDNGQELLSEEAGIAISVNETKVNYDVSPQNIDGYVMLPLRYTIRELGFVVRWHKELESIDCIKDDVYIRMYIGENSYQYNNKKPFSLKKAPVIRDGRTMVPIEFFTEFLPSVLSKN